MEKILFEGIFAMPTKWGKRRGKSYGNTASLFVYFFIINDSSSMIFFVSRYCGSCEFTSGPNGIGIRPNRDRDHKKLNPVTIRSGPDPGPSSVRSRFNLGSVQIWSRRKNHSIDFLKKKTFFYCNT